MTTATEIPAPPDGIWSMPYIVELIDRGIIQSRLLTPDETVPVSWNGVTIYVTRGIEIEVPEFHYDVYMASRRATMAATENARAVLEKRAMGPGQTSVESGWNGVDAAHPLDR